MIRRATGWHRARDECVAGRGAHVAALGLALVLLGACGGTTRATPATSAHPELAPAPASLPAGATVAAPASRAPLARALDALLDSAGPALGGASVLVVRGDTVLYDRSVGAIRGDTPIPVASAAKWIAGAVIMSLVDEGRLSLDDAVGRFLESGSAMTRGIPVRRLFSHTSGLPRATRCLGRRAARMDECAREILESGLDARPGERFAYGGASMQVAARIAELAGGAPWERLVEDRVTRPLGMRETRFPGPMPRVAGGLVSTRDEYARFLRMLLDAGTWEGRRILSPAAVLAMETDQTKGALVDPPPDYYRAGYGIGMWIDRADASGRAVELSSPGAFGFTPWIDRERRLLGVVAVRDPEGRRGHALAARVRALVGPALESGGR